MFAIYTILISCPALADSFNSVEWVYTCNSSPAKLPRLAIPEQVFVNIAKSIGAEVNRGLGFLQDISCSGNMKQFLLVCLNSNLSFLYAFYVPSSIPNF